MTKKLTPEQAARVDRLCDHVTSRLDSLDDARFKAGAGAVLRVQIRSEVSDCCGADVDDTISYFENLLGVPAFEEEAA